MLGCTGRRSTEATTSMIIELIDFVRRSNQFLFQGKLPIGSTQGQRLPE